MKLKLKAVADKGNFQRERLVIKVLNDTNVGEFLILRTGFADGQVNIDVSSAYWFPDKSVKAGDLVVLYSKPGTNKDKALDSGNKAHFYYWGESKVLWATPDNAAVLLHAPVWESASTEEL